MLLISLACQLDINLIATIYFSLFALTRTWKETRDSSSVIIKHFLLFNFLTCCFICANVYCSALLLCINSQFNNIIASQQSERRKSEENKSEEKYRKWNLFYKLGLVPDNFLENSEKCKACVRDERIELFMWKYF